MDALLWDARQWSYIESFATLARSDLEATIVEQAKQLDGIKKALTQDYNFPGLPISYSISELVAGYKDRNQSSATFMAELNAAEKVIAAQTKQLEEMAEAIRVKDEALEDVIGWLQMDDIAQRRSADKASKALALQLVTHTS